MESCFGRREQLCPCVLDAFLLLSGEEAGGTVANSLSPRALLSCNKQEACLGHSSIGVLLIRGQSSLLPIVTLSHFRWDSVWLIFQICVMCICIVGVY